LAILLFRFENS